MRRIAVSILLAVTLAGCTTRTPFGECIGLNGEEKATLRYEYSAWNIALGVIFVELIYPPISVALNNLKCPVGAK